MAKARREHLYTEGEPVVFGHTGNYIGVGHVMMARQAVLNDPHAMSFYNEANKTICGKKGYAFFETETYKVGFFTPCEKCTEIAPEEMARMPKREG